MSLHSVLSSPYEIFALSAGAILMAIGIRLGLRARGIRESASQGLTQLVRLGHGLRAALVGLSMIGWACGYFFDVPWLVVASLAVGLEELYETTLAVGLLEQIEKESREAEALPRHLHEPVYDSAMHETMAHW